MRPIHEGLQKVFCTERPVFVSTSSATGLMEAAVRNGAHTRILSLVNGAFSQRFSDIGKACGFEVDEIVVEWGEAHDPDVLRCESHFDRQSDRFMRDFGLNHADAALLVAEQAVAEARRVGMRTPEYEQLAREYIARHR